MRFITTLTLSFLSTMILAEDNCKGVRHPVPGFAGTLLEDGSIAGWARNHVNIDGMRTAYHRVGTSKGAMTTICNAGEAHLPNGNVFHGKDNCDSFLSLFRENLEKGWQRKEAGVIRWYGVVGTGEETVAGQRVEGVTPAEQPDNSGFFVSPTALIDERYIQTDQRRYVNAEKVPYATTKNSPALNKLGATLGSYGVAYNRITRQAVPFIIADHGPRVGEGSFALSRLLAGQPDLPPTRSNIYKVSVDDPNVLWVLFGAPGGKAATPYDEVSTKRGADAAYEAWGGWRRLERCVANIQ